MRRASFDLRRYGTDIDTDRQLLAELLPQAKFTQGLLGIHSGRNVDEYVAVYGEFETTYPIIQHWLEIGGTIHVDAANTSPPWTGTPSAPFPTVAMGYVFAWHGARIKIRAGLYPENLTLSKPVTLVASGGTVTIGQ